MENNPRILLIYPPITVAPSDFPALDPTLGLAYIAAVLKMRGYGVRILDALALGIEKVERADNGLVRVGLSSENIKNILLDYKPDAVGISCIYTALADNSYEIARLVKMVLPKIPVILGGAHATVTAKTILKDRNVDIVVKGEGEITMLEIMKRIKNHNSLYNVKGTVVRKDYKIIENSARELINDIDTLPMPAYELLPMDLYLKKVPGIVSYSMRKPRANIITSRGCPNNCTFCSVHSIWGRKWRSRSASKVVDEIQFLVNNYGVREIYFLDDNIGINRNRLLEICREIIDRKLNINWATPNGIACLGSYLKKSGYSVSLLDTTFYSGYEKLYCELKKIAFGVESGSDRVLQEVLKKDITIDEIKSVFALCHKHGILANAFIMLGSPGETVGDIEKTIALVKEIRPNWVACARTVLLPETDLWDYAKKNNLLLVKNKDVSRFHYSDFSLQTHRLDFSTADLRKLKNRLHLEWALTTFRDRPFHKLMLAIFALLGLLSPKFKVPGEQVRKGILDSSCHIQLEVYWQL